MRSARIRRRSGETDIEVSLKIEGRGEYDVQTPIGFLTHMLESFSRHGGFDLKVRARGDLQVDQHHLVEDLGITLGQAFDRALGTRRGINRAGYFIQPMDEALVAAAVDIAGRPQVNFRGGFRRRWCGELDTDLVEDFLAGLAIHLKANIAVRILSGRSDHHKLEAVFKALARALKMACGKDRRSAKEMPSVKGLIG
jgi:imidazoleglycerol-phosphate dehydratase